MGLEQALEHLRAEKKASRLRILWPLIEAKLAEGVSHAAVLELLNRNGFDLTQGTYKSYLHRFRKMQRQAGPRPRGETQTRLSNSAPNSTSDTTDRPPTFDYNPRGIPDLLK